MSDLEATAGGADCYDVARLTPWTLDDQWDANKDNCARDHSRQIYGGGFPNCAATVEDGGRCANKDACYSMAVTYRGCLDSCSKAWRLPPCRVLLETLVTLCGGSRHVCRNKAV